MSNPLICEICLLPFDTKKHCPRILKECGHTICEECAGHLWNQEGQRQIKCPFDRIVTKLTYSIKDLPKNFTVENVLESQKAEKVTETQIPTGRCSYDSSHEAWFSCKECEADFCESCFGRMHYQCVKSGKVNPERIPSIDKPIRPPKCRIHPDNFAEFICQDPACSIGDKVICSACLLQGHKDHKTGSYERIVAANQKKLKEIMIEKTVSEKTWPYLDGYIRKFRDSYASEENKDYSAVVDNIRCYYDNKKCEAIEKLKKFAEKKLVAANKAMAEYEDATNTEKALESIRSEIRRRLTTRMKLDNVEDILQRYRIAHEKLNRKRDTPLISPIRSLRLEFTPMEMEIIDPDEPSDSCSPYSLKNISVGVLAFSLAFSISHMFFKYLCSNSSESFLLNFSTFFLPVQTFITEYSSIFLKFMRK